MIRLARFFAAAAMLVCLVGQDTSAASTKREPLVSHETVAVPGGEVLLAIARPAAGAKGSTLLILHGTHGFAEEYVNIAREVASAGYVAIAACWFAPGTGPGLRFITPEPCLADAPAILRGDEPDAQKRIAALVAAVGRLPGVDPARIFIMGHSRGAGAAMYYALGGGHPKGIILNSGPYPPDAIERASTMAVPLLILHGEKDGASDGGSG